MNRSSIIICLFCFLMISCRPQRQLIQSLKSDSVSVQVREVEKIVRIPGDTVVLVMPVKVSDKTGYAINNPTFSEQHQTVETKRAKVKLEVNSKGEIKATAICKELEEKVTLLEKTVTNYKSEIQVYGQKESALKRSLNSAKRTLNTVLYTVVILLGLYAFIRFRSGLKSFVNKLVKP